MIVDFYEQVGYLPEAILNYLLLLGWSLDDRREFFTRDEMIANFTLERVTQSPASFDPKKLWAFEDHYMQQRSPDQKLAMMLPFLQRAKLIADPAPADDVRQLARVIAASGDRLKVAGDILAYADFFFVDEPAYDPQAVEKTLRKPGASSCWRNSKSDWRRSSPSTPGRWKRRCTAFVAAEGVKIGELIHPLRVAVTGKSVGPGLYDCLAILGRERSIARIEQAVRLRA